MKSARYSLEILALLFILSGGAVSADSGKSADNSGLGDYFFFICVHEYFKGESLDKTDSSVQMVFEELSADTQTISNVFASEVGSNQLHLT